MVFSFFELQNPLLTFFDIIVLLGMIAMPIDLFWRIDKSDMAFASLFLVGTVCDNT